MLQEKTQSSLQHRVQEYLRNKPIAYASERSEKEAVEAIFTLLKKAEEELKAAQERVDRLKWELAKSKA